MSKSINTKSRTKSLQTKSRSATNSSKVVKKSSGKKHKSDEVIQYVIPVGRNGWVVKNSKLKGCTLLSDSKREAVHYARAIAQRRGERLMVYGRNRELEENRKYRVAAKK